MQFWPATVLILAPKLPISKNPLAPGHVGSFLLVTSKLENTFLSYLAVDAYVLK